MLFSFEEVLKACERGKKLCCYAHHYHQQPTAHSSNDYWLQRMNVTKHGRGGGIVEDGEGRQVKKLSILRGELDLPPAYHYQKQ